MALGSYSALPRAGCDKAGSGGPVEVDVDDDGRLGVGSPPGGTLRLRVESSGGAMVTEWFTVNPSRSS